MRPSSALVTLLAFSESLVLASLFSNFAHTPRDNALLEARQDGNSDSTTSQRTSFDLSLTLKQGNTATTDSSTTASVTGGSSDSNQSANGTSTGSQSNRRTTYASTKTFDARLPAGGIQMITPAPTAGAQYYKIKDYVTFVWNYTSLSVTPSAIDILASCSLNAQTYTLALNQSVAEQTQAFTWDTSALQSSLVTSEYTLIVHDSAKDASAIAQAGYLATFNTFRFGLYIPQSYTPLAEWKCATCSSAISEFERQTLKVIFGTVALCILGSGWFMGVAGLW